MKILCAGLKQRKAKRIEIQSCGWGACAPNVLPVVLPVPRKKGTDIRKSDGLRPENPPFQR